MSRGRQGFTLREITIVLIILGIAAGVAVPAFARLQERAAARPGDAVLQWLQVARRAAVEYGTTAQIVLDPMSGRFRFDTTGVGGTGTLADTVLALESGTTLETDSLRVSFLFRPNGSAIADSVIVRSPQSVIVVRVDPWTGKAYASPL